MLHRLFAAVIAAATLAALGAPVMAQVTGALPPGASPAPLQTLRPLGVPAPTLKRRVMVASDVVRIGDLIDNAGDFAAVPVFRSPDVGTTGSVPARKVIEAARAKNLFGVEAGDVLEVEVSRAGRAIGRKDIEAQIARLFAYTNGLGDPANLAVTFDREVTGFYTDLIAGADLKAMRAIYDLRSGRFDVMFEVPIGVSRRTLMRYTGGLVENADAVVPTRAIARGDIIRSDDLVLERRPKADVAGDVVAAPAEAVGRAARQALRQGQPIRRPDLMKPELVKRDDSVALVYDAPGIMLTTRGKALESGGEGDVVNVLNPQTKRTIQGVVTGPGRVDIAPSTLAAATAQKPPASPNDAAPANE